MTADRRGGDAPQPNQQTVETHRSTWEDRRRHLSWKLRRRMDRRTLLTVLAVTVGGPFVFAGAQLAKIGYDNNKDKIWGLGKDSSKPVTSEERKKVDVKDKKELHPAVVDDAKALVRTVIKKPYLGNFDTSSSKQESELTDRLMKSGDRTLLVVNSHNEPAVVAGYDLVPGYGVDLSNELPALKNDLHYPGFTGDYTSNTDLTLQRAELRGALPLHDIPEVSPRITEGKMPEGIRAIWEIPVTEIPKAFSAVVNLEDLDPESALSFYSGAQWNFRARRISDGAEIVAAAGRNGQFAVRVDKKDSHGRDGESYNIELTRFYSLHAKGDRDKDRSNMSVEGDLGIPDFVAVDGIDTIKTLLKEPFQGSIPSDSNPKNPEVAKLQADFQVGNRLYTFGTEMLGLKPIPPGSSFDTPTARDSRKRPWYRIHIINDAKKRLPKLTSSIVTPELELRYKSNTELESPTQITFSGQLPLGEMASVKDVVKPAKLDDGRSYHRVEVKDIPKAFKEAFDLSYLRSNSFKPEFDFNNQRWRAKGVRDSDGAKVAIVAAPDGRFAIKIEDKDYKPGPDESRILEVPNRPPPMPGQKSP